MRKAPGSINSYLIGFLVSLILTCVSFGTFIYQSKMGAFPLEVVVAILMSLALLQLIVQLIFFLHLGHEKGPRWNLLFFAGTISIFIMVVLGSIWIMFHLNYHMMPHEMEFFLIEKEGIQKQ